MSRVVRDWLNELSSALGDNRAELSLTDMSHRVVLKLRPRDELQLGMTRREYEVAYLSAGGSRSHEVAPALRVSPATVRGTLKRVRDKLMFKTQAQLVLMLRTLSQRPRFRHVDGGKVAEFELRFEGLNMEGLTLAERDISLGLMYGMRNVEIARARVVSERTVANQLEYLFKRFQVSSRAGLVLALLEPLGKRKFS